MTKWREVRLGKIADINMGQSPKSIYYNNFGEGVRFLQGNRTFGRIYPSFDTYTTKVTKLANRGDILFTVRAPVGDMNIANHDLCIGRGITAIRGKENHKFLYYSLIHNNELLKTAENGTTYGSVNKSDLENFKIQIPNLETQEKIAHVLSTYDELIENNSRRIKILEKITAEVYKEWFVRMRFPGNEKARLDKRIPEDWEVKRIGEMFNVTSSKRVYSSDYVSKGIAFYRSKEIIELSEGRMIFEGLYISEKKYNDFKEKFGVPMRNDILLTSVGTIGIPLLIRNDEPFYFKDGNLTWIQSGKNEQLALFLYYWLKSDVGKQTVYMQTIGTSQRALTIQKLKDLKILLPIKNLILKFYEISNDIIQKINNLNRQNQNLIKQRDLLLPRLMNGTITVK